MRPTHLLLFGDQTVEKLSSIQALVRRSKTSFIAKSFLQQATDVVQLEFSKISAEERGWPHEIHSLLGLAEKNIKEPEANGIIATVLMFIGRLGELIAFAEEDPSILGSESQPTEILAFCTGSLPAAVVAAARDTSEVLKFGVEMVSIVFRMSYEISRRMRLVEDASVGWATTIVGAQVAKMEATLKEFHESQNIPEPRKLAIGVISSDWLTLIGPPSSLTRLWSWSPELDSAAKVSTDTNGPIHTSHMPTIDIGKVLGNSAILETPITSKARIPRNSAPGIFDNATLGALLREMITEIAHKPLKLSETIESCISSLDGPGEVKLTTVGPTGHLPAVQRCLHRKKIAHYHNFHLPYQQAGKARGGSDHIAIVGMSGRFPGGDTVENFWESILAGKSFIEKVPKSRFDLDEFYDPSGKKKNSTTAQHGSWLDRPGLFDNRLFNISPREAAQMDPIQRLLLTTSYEALEVAGYSPDATPASQSNRIATYFGQTGDDWHEILNNEGVDIYYVPSLARAFGPSRLNYHYKWGGGSFAVDTACATSTTAISLACSALIARECDTALAGGGSVLVSPNSFSGLSRSGMISITGGCRTYHDDADGYARGEGVGVVVLKRVEDAIQENDNILGVIRGSSRSYSSTATSITHPDGEAQGRVFDEVLHQTAVDPQDIGYVEMHGTGTQAGDATEMESVVKAVGESRSTDNPLIVGAVKANVGHGEAAAGVTSLIKVLMIMKERIIPPQPGQPFEVNRNFPPLKRMNIHIADQDSKLHPRPQGDGKAKVLLNSFDASGGNTSLIIEDAPRTSVKEEDPRLYHTITLSGRSAASLQGNMRRLLEYLERHPETNLADLAYTTTARRMHQNIRVAYTAKTTNDVISDLRADQSKHRGKDLNRQNAKAPIIFAFTGQGISCPQLGKDLFHQSPAFRALLLTYQEMAASQNLPHFIDLISEGSPNMANESATRLHLAIVALEIAIAHMLKTWGVQPDMVIGHSLGEYAALCISGVLSISDTLYLVGQRARLLEWHLKAGEYALMALRKNIVETQTALDSAQLDNTEIACLNGPNVTVVSGQRDELMKLQVRIEAGGSKATLLDVPYGFHSKQIEPILDKFQNIAHGVVFSKPTIPVCSTLLGAVVTDDSTFSPSYLARQTREPVNFMSALAEAQKAGLATERTQYVECGPEPILAGLIRSNLGVPVERLFPVFKPNEDNWKTLSALLAGLYQSGTTVNWPEYHRDFRNCLTLLNLPTYAFDEKDYWTPYVEPARAPVAADSKKTILPIEVDTSMVPGFPSASLQRVESETIQGEMISVTFISHTVQPDLLAAIQGHVVDGVTICPLSVFCDMALSASSYARHKLHPGKQVPRLSIHDMELVQPLVCQEINPAQVVRVTASYSSSNDRVDVSFSSTNGKNTTTQHGDCKVTFNGTGDQSAQFSQTLFLLKSRMKSFKDAANAGNAHRLLKPMVYKLFDSLVSYGDKYKAIDEVLLDDENQDAVAKVTLQAMEASSSLFHFNPYWMDSSVHLAGFLLNGSMKYSKDIACLSTGFDGWKTFKDLVAGKTYTCYVCMQEEINKKNIIIGDAYVFDGDELVVVTSGIKFQKMKKVVMRSLLLSSEHTGGTAEAIQANNTSARQKPQAQVTSHKSGVSTPGISSLTFSSSDSSSDRSVVVNDTDGVVDKLLAAVATESGYELSDMDEDTLFVDLGLDSLMAITTIANLKSDIGVELHGSFFMDNPTIGEAKAALRASGVYTPPTDIEEIKEQEALFVPEKVVEKVFTTKHKSEPVVQIPEIDGEVHSASEDDYQTKSKVPAVPMPPVTQPSAPSALSPTKQLTASRTSTAEASLKSRSQSPSTSSSTTTPEPTTANPQPATSSSELFARITILQGCESTTTETSKLFLFPDWSGSSVSYIQLPRLGSTTTVYGLESPYKNDHADDTWSVADMASHFLAAIRQKQSHGPFILGGANHGALYALEVSRRLLEDGEEVDGLFLLDMFSRLSSSVSSCASPEELLKELEGQFVPAAKHLTKAQRDHLQATVRAFGDHKHAGFTAPERQPRKVVLVAAKGQQGPKTLENRMMGGVTAGGENMLNLWRHVMGGELEILWLDGEQEHAGILEYPTVSLAGYLES
ncbi:MAG: hypothetical protein LQ352_005291, partial [Teloschistes flavicans]